MAEGVTLKAPETVFFSYDTQLGRDVVVEPNVVFGPGVTVADSAPIRAFSHLEGATLGEGCEVGPYARLRPGAVLEKGAKVGNFVEMKKATLGEGAKANHLTYLGDATVGAGANIGAGTITCNYDGYFKYKTEIGERAFIGSNSALVAPVNIGADAIVAAGSTVTPRRGRWRTADGARRTVGEAGLGRSLPRHDEEEESSDEVMKRICSAAVGAATLVLVSCGGEAPGETAADVKEEPAAAGTGAPANVESAAQGEGSAGQNAGRSQVSCGQDEQTVFTCPVQGGKTISVCGKDGEVEYRFGDRLPELAIKGGRFASVPYSGGGEAQIAFANGDTQYIVFSRIVRTNFTAGEPNNPEFTDGVAIVRGGELIGEKLCKSGSAESIDVNASELYGGTASELFYPG